MLRTIEQLVTVDRRCSPGTGLPFHPPFQNWPPTLRGPRNKHRKNCECCPVSLLIVMSQWLSWIQVLHCPKWRQFHTCSQAMSCLLCHGLCICLFFVFGLSNRLCFLIILGLYLSLSLSLSFFWSGHVCLSLWSNVLKVQRCKKRQAWQACLWYFFSQNVLISGLLTRSACATASFLKYQHARLFSAIKGFVLRYTLFATLQRSLVSKITLRWCLFVKK